MNTKSILLKSVFAVFFFCQHFYSFGQCQFKIRVIDSLTKDFISNVNVYLSDSLVGYTNNYGYINRNEIKCLGTLNLKHISYEEKVINVSDLNKGLNIVLLSPRILDLRGFTKRDYKNFSKLFGEVRLPKSYLVKMPYVFGELDALKAIQTFPGVSSSYEANSGLYSRGGNIDQTAIYIDDAPLYNVGHFYGFFSPFDGDAIKNLTLSTSGIYSGYGGRGSSILDVRFREGNMNSFNGNFSLGFISTKLLLEGPIIKNKMSFLGSIRFAYPGTFIGLGFNNNFFDGNIKLKYQFNLRNSFYISSFITSDYFSLQSINSFTIGNSSINKFKWGNKTATIRWDHISSTGISTQTILSASEYSSRTYFNDYAEPDFGNLLNNYSIKSQFDNFNGKLNNFKTGLNVNCYTSNPAYLIYHRFGKPLYKENILENNKAIDGCLFGEHIFKNSKFNIDLTANLRVGAYYNFIDKYLEPIFEPRLKMAKGLKSINLYMAFDKTSQYQSIIGNKQIAIPSDYWIQSSREFISQKIFSSSIGLSGNVKKYKVSLETYFKDYKNALDIRDGANLFRNRNVKDDILRVKSIAYGSEVLLERHHGRMQGHLSYTLSRSLRRSNKINNNEWFASNFDRTHMLNLAVNYIHSKKWNWGFLGIFQSGTPVTANYAYTFLYSYRNEYRLPNYYRIDFTVTKSFTIWNKIPCEWNISVFNATFAKNRTSQFPAFNSFGSLPTIPSFSIKVFFRN